MRACAGNVGICGAAGSCTPPACVGSVGICGIPTGCICTFLRMSAANCCARTSGTCACGGNANPARAACA